jgi:hypothetical protein
MFSKDHYEKVLAIWKYEQDCSNSGDSETVRIMTQQHIPVKKMVHLKNYDFNLYAIL